MRRKSRMQQRIFVLLLVFLHISNALNGVPAHSQFDHLNAYTEASSEPVDKNIDGSTKGALLFESVLIVDGTGEKNPYVADVVVNNDRIIDIGTNMRDLYSNCEHVIDGTGLVLTPGFIDSHTHDDMYAIDSGIAKISQGVTTVVVGNCGISVFPKPQHLPPPLSLVVNKSSDQSLFQSYEEYKEAGADANLNIVPLVGHSTLRVKHMKPEGSWMERGATEEEIVEMEKELELYLRQGVAGLSSGLEYLPAVNAPAAEITRLMALTSKYGAVYATHIRNEGDTVIEAVQETLDMVNAVGSDLRVVISHHKSVGKRNHERTKTTLKMIQRARDGGMNIHVDAYPYPYGSTILNKSMVEMAENVIMITDSSQYPSMSGRYLKDVAKEWNCNVSEAVDKLGMGAGAIYFHNTDENVARVMNSDFCMVGSDGIPYMAHPHPRLWGTFPRFLNWARNELNMTLGDVVRRMTSLPAKVYGLKDRGVIKVGAIADLVLFDLSKFKDEATCDAPNQPADGVHVVVVNGRIVWSHGNLEVRGAGKVLDRIGV